MVARNFCVQELPYARLLQIPDEAEFLPLGEPKSVQMSQTLQPLQSQPYQPSYYELQNAISSSCSSSMQYQTSTSCSSNCNNTVELPNIDGGYLPHSIRKRKMSYNDGSDGEEDPGDDSKSVKTNGENKKQNHNEIEKRRRDKMNTYITELSAMVPMCHAMSRKLDKLTVLRLAVQHVKQLRGAIHSYTEGHYKPSFLSDQELKQLILQVADGFLFVVGCDRGRILYVSKSVSTILQYAQGDLLGQSWFDILHPKDVAKVKEQLSSSDLNPREKLIDAKTMLPVKTDVPQGVSRLCPGARRSFFCRMKCKTAGPTKEEPETIAGSQRRKRPSDRRYSVIHCTGYLKSWAPAKIGLEEHEADNDESCNLSCLVAVGRILPHISCIASAAASPNKSNLQPIQFISRHALDGKFLFVDQRATLILGFLPQELLGTSMYEYYHHDDIHIIAECQKNALLNAEKIVTNVYRFRTKDDGYIQLQSEWKAFKNPWTKEVEYLIAKNNLILSDLRAAEDGTSPLDGLQENLEFFTEGNGREIQRFINSHVEVSKIGCQIAEQVLDLQRREEPPSENSTDSEVSLALAGGNSCLNNIYSDQPHTKATLQQTHTGNSGRSSFTTRSDPGHNADDEIIEMIEDAVKTSPVNALSNDGNDEAAMAVIMSLLEADAGLGGPVDFSGLPWPLP